MRSTKRRVLIVAAAAVLVTGGLFIRAETGGPTFKQLALPANETAAAISTGDLNTLILTRSDRVYAWGSDYQDPHQLLTTRPALEHGLPAADPVVAVSSSDSLDLALTRSGKVYAWGFNGTGQLGNGTHGQRWYAAPQPVFGLPAGDPVKAVAAGDEFGLALTGSGRVYAWGKNEDGELGTGNSRESDVAVRIRDLPAGDPVVRVANGQYFSLALTRSGRVFSWGLVLPIGGLASYVPSAVHGLPAGDPVVAIEASGENCLVLTRQGRVFAWGRNDFSQVGDGTFDVRESPVAVHGLPGEDPVMAIATGFVDNLAWTRSGKLFAWGDDDNQGTGSKIAVQVQHLPGGEMIAAYGQGGLALTERGTLYFWDAWRS